MSFPRYLRFQMARSPLLTTKILHGYLQVIFAWQRRKARAMGIVDSRCGAVTFVQRFGGFLNLNVHFHAVLPDGVFAMNEAEEPRFRRLDPPTNAEIISLAEKIIRRVAKILARHQEEHSDDQVGDALGHVQAASVRFALGSSTTVNQMDIPERSAFIGGFSLHANVDIHQNDREGIERLCRYGLRPAFALDRLFWTEEGNIRYKYKRPAPNGKQDIVCDPVDFLAKLAALIPPPRKHLTRYHGVFAPNHAWRGQIIPTAPKHTVDSAESADEDRANSDKAEPEVSVPAIAQSRRLDWAALLMRVFAIDVLECPKCQDRMRVLAVISEPDVVERILQHLELPTTPPDSSRGPPSRQRA